jgi:peroxiredoxin
LQAKTPEARVAKDLTIEMVSGKSAKLSAYKGKVVVMQFLNTHCVHCQATARMLAKLKGELGAKGLVVFGVAFNEEARAEVNQFVQSNHVSFPVGVSTDPAVREYLGISVMQRLAVPQIFVVDRKGIVRAQSEPLGTAELQDETYMRAFLSGLLK